MQSPNIKNASRALKIDAVQRFLPVKEKFFRHEKRNVDQMFANRIQRMKRVTIGHEKILNNRPSYVRYDQQAVLPNYCTMTRHARARVFRQFAYYRALKW